MPRAHHKPFTVYEEAVSFHGTRRNAYLCCALLFAGLLFKVCVLSHYSAASDYSELSGVDDDPQYQNLVAERMELAESHCLNGGHAARRAGSSRPTGVVGNGWMRGGG
ncbi:hypothetical protein TraAM80_05748 [Trypanosoma rangeli]|uniref:Transmembrane protein n=1 Tax=Trypanosoma rangeli TaxID=5698 RepID=A0A422NDL6_TRYRA|nr:uncharacterized protein TraAM80_05748 [Trypanosoma rangeli]RNF03588.1 hypothetical protein TraAM80_05748 [Trypanosoma rangeli]|eukprot:RNF03588.1 hypothetical protein TraAM80_05748 [Trypanosoma rangeli]